MDVSSAAICVEHHQASEVPMPCEDENKMVKDLQDVVP